MFKHIYQGYYALEVCSWRCPHAIQTISVWFLSVMGSSAAEEKESTCLGNILKHLLNPSATLPILQEYAHICCTYVGIFLYACVLS